jgi:hypothetical protein
MRQGLSPNAHAFHAWSDHLERERPRAPIAQFRARAAGFSVDGLRVLDAVMAPGPSLWRGAVAVPV